MPRLWRLTATASRALARWLWFAFVAIAGLCLAVALGFTLYAVGALPPLAPWHTVRLHGEFSATRHGPLDFDGYLRLEQQLFDELHDQIATWERSEAFLTSRFNTAGMPARLAAGAPFNRSFRLPVEAPVGAALLIHGLTDSPYSVKAMAEALHARGIDVTVLRLPGHGTLPSMMTEMSYRDWTAATRLAARAVAERVPAGRPFYIGGYSTGATLSLQYALDGLEDATLRRPDRVLLISPAIELTRVAALASIIDIASVVPIPLLEKVRWQEIAAEYDPYKFNSFPVNASRQVNRATKTLQRALERARKSGAIARMPAVTAWQSVVDSTVGSTGTVDVLFSALSGPQHRLVLFDVNRGESFASVQRPAARALIERVAGGPRGYTLDIVTNSDRERERVVLHRLLPDGTRTPIETDLTWPRDLVSLGHVALPFPPDDPVYGFRPGSGRDGIPSIGSWLLRGESGATTISLGALTRLRSNPFWSLITQQIGEQVDADLARLR
ncbi:MAG TPA: alpha/beta fold hydrolase [Burkholderiaceae bacterium]|nr:alpha/beta fold hydrolase [Burkholderiaceae bacterium]